MDSFKTDSYPDQASVEKGCCQMHGPSSQALNCIMPAQYGMRGTPPAVGTTTLSGFGLTSEVGIPTPLDGEVHECVGSTNWTTYYDTPSWSTGYPLGAETAFTLPVNSDTLYLLARDTVDVRVRVAYYYDEALDRATICHIERAENEQGVGIFTPLNEPHYDYMQHLKFDVTLTLPAGSDGALLVKNLETELPNYSQSMGDLWETVLFENIHLSSSNGRVHAESVTAESAKFSSLNGAITGHFNSGSSLELKTSNGAIRSTVTLLHREGADASKLKMHTSNGEIYSEVALTSDSGTGGEFEVDTESSNGSIGLTFTDSPVDSVLKCRAHTSLGKVSVELDSAYEGSYSLQNRLGSMTVEERQGVEDPAGNGRQRKVSVNRRRGLVSGSVNWVDSDGTSSGNKGSVVVETSLSTVKLVI
ncbi:hypothetical protein BU15DRAFT_72402 [Melanogaster broomeanus]|nr:hypothetical protein BU15DRAFT_72402 [Melanogaster broomeanus]